jgi:hypothetical protein
MSGECELSSDGTYWTQTRATIGGAAFQDWQQGRWTVDGDRTVLQPKKASEPILARWNASAIEIIGVRILLPGK